MKHEYYKNFLTLSVFDEISETEKTELKAHVQECTACAAEYEELVKLKELSGEALHQDVSEETLSASRQELLAQVRDLNRKKRSEGSFKLFGTQAFGRLQLAMSLALILLFTAVVYFLAIPGRNSVENSVAIREKYVIPVQPNLSPTENKEQADDESEKSKEVLAVNQRPQLNIEKQKEIAQSLANNKNTGSRLKTLNTISSKKAAGSAIIKQALIKTLKVDDNPGVRKEAMLALANLPFDRDIQNALLYVLENDKNAGMRVMAINYLDGENIAERLSDPKTVDIIREKITGDENSYVKIRAKSILKKIKV